MKSDKIKIYGGHLILPFGTPYIITTAWENKERYFTQSVAALDCVDRTISLSAHEQSFAKDRFSTQVPGSLTTDKAIEYCLSYGYNMADRNMKNLLWNYGYEKMKGSLNFPNVNLIEIKLVELVNMELGVLAHFLSVQASAFGWLEKAAKSDILKDYIKTAKNLDIQQTQTYP